jgi:hypothetical protein
LDLVDAHAPEEYCRAIEAYLCRKNDGHLIRIVGPSFDMVCGWAERGVPIKVATRGIDRYFERYYAKGPRRRPVRIDFCEADVLDVFDEWRRAVGVPTNGETLSKSPSLPSHLERVVARLTTLRAGTDPQLDARIDAIVRELDAARASAKTLRGTARAELLERLAQLDAELLTAMREQLTVSERDALAREAEAELAPFKPRMPQAAYEQSIAACINRLLRDKAHIPTLTLE